MSTWVERAAQPSSSFDVTTGSHGSTHPRSPGRRATCLLALLALWSPSHAVTGGATADDIEAAHLHKLTGYIDWPGRAFAHAGSAIVVGVVGADGLYDSLRRIAPGPPTNGRAIEVRRLTRPQESQEVHLLYLGASVWDTLPAWQAAYSDRPVVVATNAPQGVDHGATIGFVQVGQRVRLEASLPAAERAGVKLSSRLLAVAERVVGIGK